MYHQSMLEIFGAQVFTIGWLEQIIEIEYGDEHEIQLQQMEQVQQKNEDNDRVQNDIIFQVQKNGQT